MPSAIIFLLIFVLPLIVFPIGVSMFEIPKVILTLILIEVLGIIYLLKPKQLSLLKISFTHFIFYSFFLLCLFQFFLFPGLNLLLGSIFRLQGLFLLSHLLLFSYLSSKFIFSYPINWGVFCFFLLFFSAFIFNPGKNVDRLFGTMGEANTFAAVFIFLWPILYQKVTNQYLKITLPSSAFLAIFFSGSRSGLLALFIQLFFLLLKKTKFVKLSLAIFLSLTILFLSLSFPFFEKTSNWDQREQIWQMTIEQSKNNIFWGVGVGNIEKNIKLAAQKKDLLLQFAVVDNTHNFFLDWLLQTGIAGLTFIFLVLFRTFIQLYKQKNYFELAALLGIITTLSFNPASVVNLVQLFWLFRHSFVNSYGQNSFSKNSLRNKMD